MLQWLGLRKKVMIAYLLESGGLLLRLACTSDDNRKYCGASKPHFGVLHNLDVSLDQQFSLCHLLYMYLLTMAMCPPPPPHWVKQHPFLVDL